MAVLRNENRWERSNVHVHEGRLLEYDKRRPSPAMLHVDYGVSAIGAAALKSCGEVFDLADLYHRLSREGQLAAFEVTERFYEIGSPAGLAETRAFLAAEGRSA